MNRRQFLRCMGEATLHRREDMMIHDRNRAEFVSGERVWRVTIAFV
jgi:hypothetical protein